MIDARNFTALRRLFSEMPPAGVAEIISIFRKTSGHHFPDSAARPGGRRLKYFDVDVEAQQQLLRGMAEQVVSILNEMSPDDRTALLEELPSAAGDN